MLALESIEVNTTTTANREMYVITAIKFIHTMMTITSNTDITAIRAIKDIMAITASTGIRANCSQYNYYCTTANRKIYVIAAIRSIQSFMIITVLWVLQLLMPLKLIWPLNAI